MFQSADCTFTLKKSPDDNPHSPDKILPEKNATSRRVPGELPHNRLETLLRRREEIPRSISDLSVGHPMLAGYARGEFQGFGENGMSRDWRDLKGGCHGYEGMLVENDHALLAVPDDLKAKP